MFCPLTTATVHALAHSAKVEATGKSDEDKSMPMRHCAATLVLGGLLFAPSARAQSGAPLEPVQTITMPGVEGRLDHLSVDLEGSRLYVSALGNNTVEILDLDSGKVGSRIRGLREPQGVLYVPESGKLFVANGADGTVRIFNAGTDQLLSSVRFPSDADDLRYDQAAGIVYVGYGEGGLGALSAMTGKEVGRILLPGHPEGFAVEKGGGRIYVNVPSRREIAVVDWEKHAVILRWPMRKYQANFPMAFDSVHHLLFVVCRRPSEFLALDPESGKTLAHLPVVGDADDIYYDAARQRIYVSGGGGAISVIAQTDAKHYQTLATISTAPGARTSLFVPEFDRFYSAVPARPGHSAEIRVYEVEP